MIHLVYPHRDIIAAPDVIGSTLARHLSGRHSVKLHNLDSLYRIDPAPGDILIGHAHPMPGTVFRRSVGAKNWARRILMQPFNGDWNQVGFIDGVIDQCDLFLAITGRYWYERVAETAAARWQPKMVHVDLAIDRKSFLPLKQGVAPPGARKVLYIGNDHPGKNLPYLAAVAEAWDGDIDWAGRGAPLPGLRPMGFFDFSTEQGRQLLRQYDMLITLGSADANPTTILEALAWGLVPICTPTSGYVGERCILNVPGDDVSSVCAVLDRLQRVDSAEIEALREEGLRRLDEHYNWQRFARQVEEAIDSVASPMLSPRGASPRPKTSFPPKLVLRILAKNLGYALEKYVPGFTLRGGKAMWLRNLLRF